MTGKKKGPLENLQSPSDLKKMSIDQLNQLAEEMRVFIYDSVSETGGHLASNLGVVELSIALHYSFNSPRDSIIWDVGHQSYPHKIICGRKELFKSLRKKNGLSGFPKRSESEHDILETGHSSTSISAALGLLSARDCLGEEGKVIAVIGDGALTGGMAFEALNHAGHLKKNLIVILNDNAMSISPNVGAVSSSLGMITANMKYQVFRDSVDSFIKSIPLLGNKLLKIIYRLKKGLKAIFFKESLFSDFGFEYAGPFNGHDIKKLINLFANIKKLNRPLLVHVVTQKGKGYPDVEEDPSAYHGVSPSVVVDGEKEKWPRKTYTKAFADQLMRKAAQDPRLCVVCAAMASGTGVQSFAEKYPERFFDVGIAEQHALTFAAGMALAGMRPLVAIYSTFMQRGVDQLIHDIAIQKLPLVVAMDRAGLVPGDGETHQGIFDVALFRPVPNISFLAPVNETEMGLSLDWAFKQEAPVLLRYSKDFCLAPDCPGTDQPLVSGRGVFLREKSSNVLIISFGQLLQQALLASSLLEKKNIEVDVYNLRFLKPLDEEFLFSILENYQTIIFLEDGTKDGGVGQWLGAFCQERGLHISFYHFAVGDEFPSHQSRMELLRLYRLDAWSIASFIEDQLMQGDKKVVFKAKGSLA